MKVLAYFFSSRLGVPSGGVPIVRSILLWGGLLGGQLGIKVLAYFFLRT